MSQFQHLVQRQTFPSRQRDIAAEAYSDAILYLEAEFKDDDEGLRWLRNATSTSLDDLLEATTKAEAKYRQASQRKDSILRWLEGLSSRVMYYGRVLDTLAQHHPEYVGLVWGAMKFVLMGIISHGNLVAQFSQALSTISEVLPNVKVTAELYQTEQMKHAIASLYAHVMLFLKQALKWYNVSPASRIVKSLFKPFELSYKETVDQIKRCTQTINDIADIAAKSEIREVKVYLQAQISKVDNLETQLYKMQEDFIAAQAELTSMMRSALQIASQDTAKLSAIHVDIGEIKPHVLDMHFSHVLGVLKPRQTPEEALAKHQSLVRRARPWNNRTRNMVELLQSVGNWISSPASALLVLQTQARAQTRVKQLATDIISHLQPQSKQLVWYLSNTSGVNDATRTSDLIRSFVYQCLTIKPDLVTACPHSLTVAKLQSPHSDDEWLALLLSIMEQLHSCFIIIEAEDILKESAEGNRLNYILQQLSRHCSTNGLMIKLLVVSYDRSWEELDDLGKMHRKIVEIKQDANPRKMRRGGSGSIFSKVRWSGSIRR